MDSTDQALFLSIAAPVLMGVVAVGALLFIKISRRRQRGQSHDAAVPVVPMSAGQARRLIRGYLWVMALLVAGLGITFVVMAEVAA